MEGATGALVEFRLNGESRRAARGAPLLDVLRDLGVDAERIALERNGEVVPRAEHAGLLIAEGDAYEVVQFVGGG